MKAHAAVPTLLFLALAACSDTSSEPGPPVPAPSRAGWETNSAFPGFTLVQPLESRVTYLVDMSGTAVHRWTSTGLPGSGRLTGRGTLLQTLSHDDHPIFRGGGMCGGIEELAWDGSVLWTFDWDSESGISHHDIEELPNGNVLFIAWDRHTRKEALAAGRDPELLAGQELWPDAIYEVRPTRPVGGEIVWSWHAWDHLIQDVDPDAPNYGLPRERPERIDINGDRNPDPPSEEQEAAELAQMQALGYVGGGPPDHDGGDDEDDPEEVAFRARIKNADWMHSNGLDYHAELDQIVLSVRRFDEVWILDHSTTTEQAAGSTGGRFGKGGDLLYRWGNPYAYGRGTWADRQLLGQHNAQWIPDGYLGAGGLLVFDNGTKKDRAWSMVKEWWPPRDAAGHYLRDEGEPFGPAAPDWSYQAEEPGTFFSSFISGAQRLPNGNTLVCAGKQGWVFEVTPAGDVVWDWLNPYGLDLEVDEAPDPDDDGEVPQSALFRAERYAPDHPALVALRAKGAPIPDDPGSGPATNQGEWPLEDDEESASGR